MVLVARRVLYQRITCDGRARSTMHQPRRGRLRGLHKNTTFAPVMPVSRAATVPHRHAHLVERRAVLASQYPAVRACLERGLVGQSAIDGSVVLHKTVDDREVTITPAVDYARSPTDPEVVLVFEPRNCGL